MNYIKKNKYTILAILVFVLLVFVGVEIKNILVPDEGRAVYGNRLDNIEKYPISTNTFTDIETGLKENSKVVNVTNTLHGKIINLIITVTDDVTIEEAKILANSTISFFKNNELDYYSLNVYVKKLNPELNNFPIEGYKDPESKDLVFTKDREIIKGEEDE